MAKVGIVMGSDSDMPVMAKAAEILDKLGVEYEMTIISAHREPDIFFAWAKSAEEKGFKVIIAGAGKAAHLPGMCAAIFPLPVIGIPMKTSDWEAWTPCIPLCRCQAAFPWPQWPSTAEPTRAFWRQRSWQPPMRNSWAAEGVFRGAERRRGEKARSWMNWDIRSIWRR